MSQDRNQPTGKRPLGRPKGTAPFEERDRAALSQFADQKLQAPSAKLAPFLTSKGYEEKDIRRAQARWRNEKDGFLRQAQHRLDLSPAESIVQLFANMYATIGDVLATAGPGLRKIAASQERARRHARALEVEGRGPGLPIDLDSQAEIDAAVERYEARMFGSEEDRLAAFGLHTTKTLPTSLKLYAVAVLFHQMSLEEAEREAAESNSDAEPTSGEGPK